MQVQQVATRLRVPIFKPQLASPFFAGCRATFQEKSFDAVVEASESGRCIYTCNLQLCSKPRIPPRKIVQRKLAFSIHLPSRPSIIELLNLRGHVKDARVEEPPAAITWGINV